MKTCSKCGKQMTAKHDIRFGDICQACYTYYHNGGTDNPIPPKGRIMHDARGCIICHICGRAYVRLGSHVRESHGMTIDEYKKKFGLCSRARTTEDSYSKTMSQNSYKYGMDKRLMEAGKSTRIKKGETRMRKGKATRLQEILEKRDRRK